MLAFLLLCNMIHRKHFFLYLNKLSYSFLSLTFYVNFWKLLNFSTFYSLHFVIIKVQVSLSFPFIVRFSAGITSSGLLQPCHYTLLLSHMGKFAFTKIDLQKWVGIPEPPGFCFSASEGTGFARITDSPEPHSFPSNPGHGAYSNCTKTS